MVRLLGTDLLVAMRGWRRWAGTVIMSLARSDGWMVLSAGWCAASRCHAAPCCFCPPVRQNTLTTVVGGGQTTNHCLERPQVVRSDGSAANRRSSITATCGRGLYSHSKAATLIALTEKLVSVGDEIGYYLTFLRTLPDGAEGSHVAPGAGVLCW